MEQIVLGVIILTIVIIILIQNGELQNKVNELKQEQERHNNIQRVIMDQVDQIAQEIGV